MISIAHISKYIFAATLLLVTLFGAQTVEAAQGIHHVGSGGLRTIYVPKNFQINSPQPPSIRTYEPGEQFHVQMDFWAGGCNNGTQYVKLRVTDPLLAGETVGWGPWKNIGSQGASGGHDDYNAHWNKSVGPLTAPEEEGIYRVYFHIENQVNWSIGTQSNNWYKGYIEIEVKVPDMCPRIPGAQEEVPGGYTINGDGYCVLSDTFQILCSANPNPIAPGGETTFTALPFNAEGDVTFTWYDSADAVLSQETHGSRSRFTQTFDTTGLYQVAVVAEDETGATFRRSCGVTVRDPDDPGTGPVDLDGDGMPDDPGVTGPLAPPAVVTLSIDRPLTNDVCALNWNAQYVTQCFLVNGTGGVEGVPLSETRDVSPGTYWLRCLTERDGSVEESEQVVCRLNPDTREI